PSLDTGLFGTRFMAMRSFDDEEPPIIAPLPSSPQFLVERDALDPALREIFDRLVEAYRFYAFSFYHRPFVSYRILAALVRDGWRLPSATPTIQDPNAAQNHD